MMELLIDDMLDQAKMDNHVFKLNEEYFDLSLVIFKAFNLIRAKANFSQIKLVAEVENPEHLALISNLFGDQ